MLVLGVMSGSSLDGVDIALVNLSAQPIQWKLIQAHSLEFPETLKDQLSIAHTISALELMEVEYTFTQFIADGLNTYLETHNLEVDLIGVHGHTLCHQPRLSRSWQLINGGMLAELCRCPVVCDFRNQDMALGGQGAPMAILADRDLFAGYDYYLNLGGIANLATYRHGQVAYDICPCNQLLNYYAQVAGYAYDDKGQIAKSGQVSEALLQYLHSDPYLSQKPPKSLDNGHSRSLITEINKHFELSTEDKLRTMVEYIAEVIASTELAHQSQMLVTGGGAYNAFLIERLSVHLEAKRVSIVMPDRTLIDNKEAILIAYAAYLRYKGIPNFISPATGASADAIGGALYTCADA